MQLATLFFIRIVLSLGYSRVLSSYSNIHFFTNPYSLLRGKTAWKKIGRDFSRIYFHFFTYFTLTFWLFFWLFACLFLFSTFYFYFLSFWWTWVFSVIYPSLTIIRLKCILNLVLHLDQVWVCKWNLSNFWHKMFQKTILLA